MSKFVLKDGNWTVDSTQEQGETVSPEEEENITKELTDTAKRVIRTFVQTFIGSLSLALPTVAVTTDYSVLGKALLTLLVTAALSGAISVVALAQNKLEDSGILPSTK